MGVVAGFTVGHICSFFSPKNLHYPVTGEDNLACPPQQECIREEEKGVPHWDQLQPCTRPAVEISPAWHDEDVHVIERWDYQPVICEILMLIIIVLVCNTFRQFCISSRGWHLAAAHPREHRETYAVLPRSHGLTLEQMQAVREFIICDQDNTDYVYFCMLQRGYVLYVWIYLSNWFGACWPARGVWQRRVHQGRWEERMCVSILIIIYTQIWRRPPPVIMPIDTEKDVTAKCIPNSVIYNMVRAPKIQCPHDVTRSYLPYKYLHEQIIKPLNKTKGCHLFVHYVPWLCSENIILKLVA